MNRIVVILGRGNGPLGRGRLCRWRVEGWRRRGEYRCRRRRTRMPRFSSRIHWVSPARIIFGTADFPDNKPGINVLYGSAA